MNIIHTSAIVEYNIYSIINSCHMNVSYIPLIILYIFLSIRCISVVDIYYLRKIKIKDPTESMKYII